LESAAEGGDISYIWTAQGWLYLAVILDLHSRRVVGWPFDALWSQRSHEEGFGDPSARYGRSSAQATRGFLFHSDRGSQYSAYDYQKKLQAYGLRPSMSGKGNCYDNASVETFFKTIKAELIWRQSWPTRRQAETAIFQYINGF
jgi:putative transposase